jgi:hypothetical protein
MSDDERWRDWFEANRALLEDAYMRGHSTWQQSGFGLRTTRDERAWSVMRCPRKC